MEKTTDKGIKVVAGVSEALNYRRKNPGSSDEKVFNHIMKFLKDSDYKDEKLDIIAGVSFALKVLERQPKLKDREVINLIMKDLNQIVLKD